MIPALHRPVPHPLNTENPFGQPLFAYSEWGYLGHHGIDFLCPVGTPVRASDGGTVVNAGPNGTAGWMVTLRHSWGVTRYLHLSDWYFKAGAPVERGQVIGLSGGAPEHPGAGMSTGPHLHLDMYPDGESRDNGYGGRVDPVPYLEGNGMSLEGTVASLEGTVSQDFIDRLRGYAAELSRARGPGVARRRTIADELRHDAETLEAVLS